MLFFFFNDTATTEIYTLSLHDALPICARHRLAYLDALDARERDYLAERRALNRRALQPLERVQLLDAHLRRRARSEERTSELQSRQYLVCRLLLEKKKKAHSICLVVAP